MRELHEAQAAAQQARDGAASFERRLQESHVQAAAAQAQASQLQAALGAAQEQAATLQRQKLERDSEVRRLEDRARICRVPWVLGVQRIYVTAYAAVSYIDSIAIC